MLKLSTPELQVALLKLLNLVLESGCFPDDWNKVLISPIYKTGNKLDPENYRGICVSSNEGKVVCSILNLRVQSYLIEHYVLSKNLIGFLPKHRSTDHIFTLNTLVNKHVHQRNRGGNICMFH